MGIFNRADPDGHRFGFSLVELLVVTAIVATLVGLLLPALARSREKSRKANCHTLLRHMYLLTRMYADEHDGEMPLRSTLFSNGAVPNCPSAQLQNASGANGYSWLPYYLTQDRVKVKIDPQWILVGDRRPWHDPNRIWHPPPMSVWTGRHNLVYGDGHLEWIQQSSPP